ncbi:hypothetical protein Slin15195_G052960 [Septoria linicola]|uniref:Uncharacterized protein n=1 Tax=Septoria linicola TaxID=215465 RepID=A0A9Q9EJB0_9PEZI|nr:hypothetical protein Slin14017_G123750 [Septoria linicola]USW51977.1 hypothetical protein Slin15195_G052960 [Septoria linicola]
MSKRTLMIDARGSPRYVNAESEDRRLEVITMESHLARFRPISHAKQRRTRSVHNRVNSAVNLYRVALRPPCMNHTIKYCYCPSRVITPGVSQEDWDRFVRPVKTSSKVVRRRPGSVTAHEDGKWVSEEVTDIPPLIQPVFMHSQERLRLSDGAGHDDSLDFVGYQPVSHEAERKQGRAILAGSTWDRMHSAGGPTATPSVPSVSMQRATSKPIARTKTCQEQDTGFWEMENDLPEQDSMLTERLQLHLESSRRGEGMYVSACRAGRNCRRIIVPATTTPATDGTEIEFGRVYGRDDSPATRPDIAEVERLEKKLATGKVEERGPCETPSYGGGRMHRPY